MSEEKGLTFKLDESMVREALQQALVSCLKPEERDKLVSEAVRALLHGSFMNPSEVQRIFSAAAASVARKLAEEEFAKPENADRVRAIVVEAYDKATTGDARAKLVENVASKISIGIFGDRY